MRVLGIDYGKSKIGLAVGDTETKLSEPLKVLSMSNVKCQMSNIVQENNICKIIVGLTGGRMDEEIKDFGEKLAKETVLPVEYFDETLTTQDAQRILINSGGKRKKRKEKEDAVAAALMLENYLNSL